MRYAKPRQLKTKRGARKENENAWCLTHRKPMEKHGAYFQCPTHWSVKISGISKQVSFTTRSRRTTGRVEHWLTEKYAKPYCIRCKIRMVRHSKGNWCRFICGNCGNTAVASSDLAGQRIARRAECARLLREGRTGSQIRAMGFHPRTVRQVQAEVGIIKCRCGKPNTHRGMCKHRRRAERNRPLFDELEHRIRRAVPSGLFSEIGEEITSMIFLDIAEDINRRIGDMQGYIRKYKRIYPQRLSLDDDSLQLADRLEG